MRRGRIPSEPEIEEAKVGQLLTRVRSTLTAGDFRHYDHLIETLLEEGNDSMDLLNALFHRLALGDPEPPADPKQKGSSLWGKPATPAPAPTAGVPPTAPVSERPQPRPRPVAPVAAELRRPASGQAPARPATPTGPRMPETREPGVPATPVRSPASAPAIATPRPTAPARPPQTPPPPPSRETTPSRNPSHIASPASRSPAAPKPAKPYPTAAKPTPAAAPSAPAPALATPVAPPEPPQPPAMVPLWVNVGTAHAMTPEALISCIQGETGLPKSVLGNVNVAEDHSKIDVAEPHARSIISRLNRAQLNGRRLRAKLA